MTDFGEKKQNNSLVKFVGRPNDVQDKLELSRWKKFLKAIWPWAKEGGKLISRSKKLTEDYYQAEVTKKQNEASKFAAEASNIAAEKDLKIQNKVKVVNDEIARIFSDDKVPDFAKKLQLTNLLANNPEIAQQLNKIEDMVDKLSAVNFSKFNLEIDERKKQREAEDITPKSDEDSDII